MFQNAMLPAAARKEEVVPTGHQGDVLCCSYAPGENVVASGGWDGQVVLWDRTTGEPVAQWKAGDKPISAITVAPDNSRILTGSMDGLFGQWDLQTYKRVSLFLAHTRPISTITYSADGQRAATSSWDGTIILWNLAERFDSGRPLGRQSDIVAGCDFCPDGKHLLSWSNDGTLTIWDYLAGRPIANWTAHGNRVTAAAVAPDGRWFASGSRDGTVSLWDTSNGESVARYNGSSAEIRGCFFSSDAESLYTITAKGELVTHAVPHFGSQTGEQTGGNVLSASLAPTGDQIALGTEDGKIKLVPIQLPKERPICVTAIQAEEQRPKNGFLNKLLGQQELQRIFRCTCPLCRKTFELNNNYKGTAVCPACTKRLRVNSFTLGV